MAGGVQLAEENKVKREQFHLLTTRVLATVECLKFLRLMVVRYTPGRRLRAALSILMRRISRILGPALVRTSTVFVVVWVISFCCRTINRIKWFENVRTLPLANPRSRENDATSDPCVSRRYRFGNPVRAKETYPSSFDIWQRPRYNKRRNCTRRSRVAQLFYRKPWLHLGLW